MLPCPIKSFGEKNPFLHKITFFIEKKKNLFWIYFILVMELDILLLGKEPYQKPFFFFIALEAKKKKKKKKRGWVLKIIHKIKKKETSIHFFIC